MGTQVIMPQLGESVVEGKISRWLKQIGEPVKMYEPILEVETDKVTTEVTAAGEGTLLKLYASEGDVVKAGTLIAFIGAAGEVDSHSTLTPALSWRPAVPPLRGHGKREEKVRSGNGSSARISPVVARIAAEHNIDVSLIHGTGEGGRVTKKDILAYVEFPSPCGRGCRRRRGEGGIRKTGSVGAARTGRTFPAHGRTLWKSSANLGQPDCSGGSSGRARRSDAAQQHAQSHCRSHGHVQAYQPARDHRV